MTSSPATGRLAAHVVGGLRVEQGRNEEASATVARAILMLDECQRQRDAANARSPGLKCDAGMPILFEFFFIKKSKKSGRAAGLLAVPYRGVKFVGE